MGDEVHLWRVGANEELTELAREPLDLESRLQEWLARDISILDPRLVVIGREVETEELQRRDALLVLDVAVRHARKLIARL